MLGARRQKETDARRVRWRQGEVELESVGRVRWSRLWGEVEQGSYHTPHGS